MSGWSPARQAYSTWTPARVNLALALRAEGRPSHQIGAELGVSENAVIGKLWRLAEATAAERHRWNQTRNNLSSEA